jgi:hypothetical protein
VSAQSAENVAILERLVPDWQTLTAQQVDALLAEEPIDVRIPLVDLVADFRRMLDADPGPATTSANGNGPKGRSAPENGTSGETSEQIGPLVVVPLAEFAGRHEASADPLYGTPEETVVAAGGRIFFYGDGGTSKTTVSVDAAAHGASGTAWLGIAVPRPLRFLVIENEGPRGKFREKLERKQSTWTGPPFAHNVFVLEEPWARFSFAIEPHRVQLAAFVREHEIDVVMANPVAEIGHEGGGTPDDVSRFGALADSFIRLAGRPVALWLVHHENKGGDVSGAWERWPDTLVHVRLEGREKSVLHWRKVRWSSELHNTRMTLRWLTESAGFAVEDAGENTAIKKAAEIEQATAWIVDHVTAHPGLARSKIEEAYHDAHNGGRNRAREAIDAQLARLSEWNEGGEHLPLLATGSGAAKNGTYLYPFSEARSPLAVPLFGEHGEQNENPAPGRPLASSPPPRRAASESASKADGVTAGAAL